MASPGSSHVARVLAAIQSRQQAPASAVAASWCRSALSHGLDPAHDARGARLTGSELALMRGAHDDLLHVAGPVLDSLFRNVGATGCCVILTNAQGIVLESRSPGSEARVFESIGLAPGADWSEANEGTNGIGTCLVEGRAVTIQRNEHFASRNIGVSCMDAPVFGPDGQLVGALDISSGRADHNQAMSVLMSALVQDAARQIERDYFCQRFAGARIVYAPDPSGRGTALLAVDKDDLVIGATRAARRQFNLSPGDLGAARPVSDILDASAPAGFLDGERAVLRQALARSGGNVTAAARGLGIGRATFYRRMERAGLVSGH